MAEVRGKYVLSVMLGSRLQNEIQRGATSVPMRAMAMGEMMMVTLLVALVKLYLCIGMQLGLLRHEDQRRRTSITRNVCNYARPLALSIFVL